MYEEALRVSIFSICASVFGVLISLLNIQFMNSSYCFLIKRVLNSLLRIVEMFSLYNKFSKKVAESFFGYMLKVSAQLDKIDQLVLITTDIFYK